jgi:geranylgeranyl pyrophosphate synthase
LKNPKSDESTDLPSPLLHDYRDHILGLTSVDDYPGIQQYLKAWLDRREKPWVELAELCFKIAGGKHRERLERVLAGWMILFAVSGPLDDYVDQDKVPDAWDELGRDVGTFVAMAMVAEALTIVAGPDEPLDATLAQAVGVFARYLKIASLGQAMDAAGVRTLDEYEHMLEHKASSLVAALTESVAVVAEAEADLKHVLTNFGNELGIVIQIINDYLGIWRPDVVAKDGGSDLDQAKLTYPILYALQVDHPHAVEFRQLLDQSPGKRDVVRMLEILNEIGAPEFMLAAIGVRRARAIGHLRNWASQDDIDRFELWFEENLMGKARM